MAVDLSTKTPAELRTMIANCERARLTASDRYKGAVKELNGRDTTKLDLDVSLAAIVETAKQGRFIGYREVAERNGAEWSKTSRAIIPHLIALSRQAHAQGWPMISAIVVNKPNLQTGDLEPPALAGFCACARGLGYQVEDEAAFLKDQQAKVFDAAKKGVFG